MCYYPQLIPNKKYQPNKKNGGYVDYEKMAKPTFDKRVLTVPIGCGNCIECRKAKQKEWQVRLLEDVRHNKNGKFITLTFSNEKLKELAEKVTQKETKTKIIDGYVINTKGELVPKYKSRIIENKLTGRKTIRYIYQKNTEEIKLKGYETDNEIATYAVRKFLERWRKKYKKSARHWFVTELGHQNTEHVHMHGIIWTDVETKEIAKLWDYGYIWIGEKNQGKIHNYVNEKTVNYITKYVGKMDFDHMEYKSKILTSAGIGEGYFKRKDWQTNKYSSNSETKEYYTTRTGHKMSLPIYWRNKIYSDEEREKLWIEKLNKETRWVGGEQVSIKEGWEEYWGVLEHYRNKNNRLGYGNGTIDWDRKQYEKQLRNLKIQERIGKINEYPDWVLYENKPNAQESGLGWLRPTTSEELGF